MKTVSVIYTAQGYCTVYNTPPCDSFIIMSWLVCLVDARVVMVMIIMTLGCNVNLCKAVFHDIQVFKRTTLHTAHFYPTPTLTLPVRRRNDQYHNHGIVHFVHASLRFFFFILHFRMCSLHASHIGIFDACNSSGTGHTGRPRLPLAESANRKEIELLQQIAHCFLRQYET